MAFDGEGNFTRLHNWENDRLNEIGIMADRHDEEDDSFAGALNECFLRDGRVSLSGHLKMGDHQIKNLAPATVSTDAVNKAQLESASENVTESLTLLLNKLWKIGDIKASTRASNHDHWFLCNGQAVSRTTYSELFEIIGTNFGSGDGVNTFNLPDYRGKFLRGLGGDSQADIYTTQAEGLPNITGSAYIYSRVTGEGAFGAENNQVGGIDNNGSGNKTLSFDASRSSSIYGASEHVTPINQAVNWFIKVREE